MMKQACVEIIPVNLFLYKYYITYCTALQEGLAKEIIINCQNN